MTEAEYQRLFRGLPKGVRAHPLYGVCKAGYSAVNAIYLQALLRVNVLEEEVPAADSVPDVVRELWRQRHVLFGQMAKQSNRFHACKSKEERAGVSVQIMGIWAQITQVKQQIADFEASGKLPAASEPEKKLDPVEALRQVNNCRSQISKAKARMKNQTDAGKIAAEQKKLSEWENQKALLEALIREYEDGKKEN